MTQIAKDHWQKIYQSKQASEVSWYQKTPEVSLQFINNYCDDKQKFIVDAGGGASTLVDHLVHAGYQNIVVLDLSASALQQSQQRIQVAQPNHSSTIEWIDADITQSQLPHKFDIWHDRAVFHFLTDTVSRQSYIQNLKKSLHPGGYLVMATFALDGPKKCSGLEIVQYDADKLQQELGSSFTLLTQQKENHRTPFETAQSFNYFVFRYLKP